MEPSEDRELSDRELSTMLGEWKAPPAPARLRAAIFPEPSASGWRRVLGASIRIPAPVACCVLILLALGAWSWFAPPPVRVVTKIERIEVPVVKTETVTKTVYRDRIVRVPAVDTHALQPVTELRARIVRSGYVQN